MALSIDTRPTRLTGRDYERATALALTIGIVAWAIVNLANGWVGFATIVPIGVRGGSEAAISLARLFAAWVLLLIIADGAGRSLRWLASGFIVLGLGQLFFGYLEPILNTASSVNDSLYQMILVRTIAAALFVVGLVPREPPPFTWRTATGVMLISGVCMVAFWTLKSQNALPTLVHVTSLEEAARLQIAPFAWLTGWHWLLAALPLGLAVMAAVGAVDRTQRGELGNWLPLSIILLAGSELHDAFWPSAYGSAILMTTADVLRLAMAAVVVIGGALELRRIAAERTALLAGEQEHSRRLEDLSQLKADFTIMVAHELGHPLSAIRRLTELLSREGLDPELRHRTLETIKKETDALDALVADVQATAAVEHDDFKVTLRPVRLGALIDTAALAIDARAAHHALETDLVGVGARERVLADPERIGQVLRNLLSNAVKYSPEKSRILLRAASTGDGHVRIEVADCGPGVHPEDRPRIFEKFGRGRHGAVGRASGAGVGLYLSRRIVCAHGSDLTVQTRPEAGSVFAFELERAREGIGESQS